MTHNANYDNKDNGDENANYSSDGNADHDDIFFTILTMLMETIMMTKGTIITTMTWVKGRQ